MRLKDCAAPLLALTLLAAAGCGTTGGGSQFEAAVYDTQRRMVLLDKNLGGSIDKLNETAAELSAQVSNSDQEMGQLRSMTEENQMRLKNMEQNLDSLTKAVYQNMGLTPPSAGGMGSSVEIEPPKPSGTSYGPRTSNANTNYMEEPISVPSTPAPTPSVTPPAPTPAPVMPANTEEEASRAYQQAMKTFEAENYRDALQQYDSFLKTYPDSSYAPQAIFFKAKSQQRLGMNKEALEGFQDFRKADPGNDLVPIAMHNQAVVYSKMGDFDSAKSLLRELIAKFPASPAAAQATQDLRKLEQY